MSKILTNCILIYKQLLEKKTLNGKNLCHTVLSYYIRDKCMHVCVILYALGII